MAANSAPSLQYLLERYELLKKHVEAAQSGAVTDAAMPEFLRGAWSSVWSPEDHNGFMYATIHLE